MSICNGNRLSLPILRQKIALTNVRLLLTCRMVGDMGFVGSKYLEHNFSIRTESKTEYMNNQTLNETKQNRIE
jgi:hypothetical protein